MSNLQTSNLHIGIVSDIIFAPHFFSSTKQVLDKNLKIFYIPYGQQNEKEYSEQLLKSEVIIVWLNFATEISDFWNASYSQTITDTQIIDLVVSLCVRLYIDLKKYKKAFVFWFLFEDYFSKLPVVTGCNYNSLVDKINIKLSETIENTVSFISLKRLIAQVGITNAYDNKAKYRWNAPYSQKIVEAAVREICKQYFIENGVTKKCIVFDCDNVLWGGVLSEDGIENIKLGRGGLGGSYQDFQRFLLSLYYHGIILAVCSRNDLPDVMAVFHEHSEMILKEEHIACFKVNWGNKVDNIKQISETLNIGLESMVFIDDSPEEIGAVKALLPEVTALLYDRETVYDKLLCFNIKQNINIDSIKKRNDTYKTDCFRKYLKSHYDNYDEYITSLEIKLDIHEALPIEFARISEITQRANKCTNGKRYTVVDIKEHLEKNNYKLYSVCVSDRFSDLGLVGTVEVKDNILTLFSLSCRALGRNIENSIFDFICRTHQIYQIEFQSTGKNEELKAYLQERFSFMSK